MKINTITGVIAGNFDVIHPGYIHLFNQCKKHCDKLLIFLHEDPSLERSQKLKPILMSPCLSGNNKAFRIETGVKK